MAEPSFSSMSAVPGVRFEPLVPVNVSKLENRDATAAVRRSESYLEPGQFHEHTEWRTAAGRELDRSPASTHLGDEERRVVPEAIAGRISEALMLPGTASDYHFGILQASEALWSNRTRDPRAFGWIEALCLADIAMFEGIPGLAARVDEEHQLVDARSTIPAFPSFNRLSGIWLREGYLAASADLEARLYAMTGSRNGVTTMADRQHALRSGDAG